MKCWRWNRQCSKMSASNIQMPGKYPEDTLQLHLCSLLAYSRFLWAQPSTWSETMPNKGLKMACRLCDWHGKAYSTCSQTRSMPMQTLKILHDLPIGWTQASTLRLNLPAAYALLTINPPKQCIHSHRNLPQLHLCSCHTTYLLYASPLYSRMEPSLNPTAIRFRLS
jgi:hypothetical protein